MAYTGDSPCTNEGCLLTAEVECEQCGMSFCRGHAKHPAHDAPRDHDRGGPEVPSGSYGPE